VKTRPLPCSPRRFRGCRAFTSANWWAWQGLEWADYWWIEHEQPGADPEEGQDGAED
jgi:hypothetical protein